MEDVLIDEELDSEEENKDLESALKEKDFLPYLTCKSMSWFGDNWADLHLGKEHYLAPLKKVTSYYNSCGSTTFEIELDNETLLKILTKYIDKLVNKEVKRKLKRVKKRHKNIVSNTIKDKVENGSHKNTKR